MALLNTKMKAGKTVTHEITPKITPFAITIPRSSPNVKLIKHKAMKPATVVIELLTTEDIVAAIASAIADLLSPSCFSSSSSKLCHRNIE